MGSDSRQCVTNTHALQVAFSRVCSPAISHGSNVVMPTRLPASFSQFNQAVSITRSQQTDIHHYPVHQVSGRRPAHSSLVSAC